MGILMMLSGCTSHKVATYHGQEPPLDLKEYFNGPIKGWGIVQDRSGKVIQRFDVQMVGSWEGDTGTLKEDFKYYDGKTEERVWIITKKTDDRYEGTASDIVGKAKGNIAGNTMRWDYEMNLEVKGSTYKITFDDWMFHMNDGVLINRSYLKKFGITMAELTLFMQKQ